MGKTYIITDTHLGHEDMYSKFKKRPIDFEKRIYKGLSLLKEEDTLIHLGDFCIGNDLKFAKKFKEIVKCKRMILVKGNHDKKSDKWYQENAGFSYVVEWMLKKIKGKLIYFTHKPSIEKIGLINIHWHTHWNWYSHESKRKKERSSTITSYELNFEYDDKYHVEFALELEWYRPISLDSFLNKNNIFW